ncbi:MAG: hypothetical protein ACXWEY_16985, partial [Bacteroidia bacterium]
MTLENQNQDSNQKRSAETSDRRPRRKQQETDFVNEDVLLEEKAPSLAEAIKGNASPAIDAFDWEEL